ncbi:MAG: hypothetical protein PHN64_03480 [Desulfovibrionaceae bacterium]|nr:hypothetical protein [Desulfovibrionaceae bacterium]
MVEADTQLQQAKAYNYTKSLYQETDTARIALATRNSLGMANVTAADLIATPMRARAFRPYPPAGLAFNGTYLAEEIEGAITVSWKHRDRWEQIDTLVTQSEANVGPEEGTTYNLKVYDENNVLKKNLTGLTGTSWTWDTEASDCEFSAITKVAVTGTVYGTSTTTSAKLETSAYAGDIELAWVFHSSALTIPEGYTLHGSAQGTDGSSTVYISLLQRTISATGTLPAETFTQASAGNMGVHLQLWRFGSGNLTLSPASTQVQDSASSRNIVWPAHIAPVSSAKTLIGGVSTYAHSGYTKWTASSGEIMSTVQVSNNRLVCGTVTQAALGDALAGYYQFDDSARLIGTAAIAVTLIPPPNIIVREYNRSIRVELEAMRDGYASWQKWNHTVTRKNVKPEAPVNLLLAHMSAGTATGNGITASIDAEGILTLNGTASAVSNIKYTGGLDINASRPSTWDRDSVLYEGTTALTLAVTVVGGTYSLPEGVTDCLNITTRYSTASIFLNAKLGDGITSINGTPASPVKMGVIYLRTGVVLENLQLRLTLHEGL